MRWTRSIWAPVAACLASLTFGAVPATAQMIDDRQRVINVSIGSLTEFLDDAGWPNETAQIGGDTVIVTEVSGNALVLWPRACDVRDRCAGLLSFAILDDRASAAEVNAFNNTHHAARATVRDGRVVIDSYTYADFGVVRGTLLVELAVLGKLVDDWWGRERPLNPRMPRPPVPPMVSGQLDEVQLTQAAFDTSDITQLGPDAMNSRPAHLHP